MSSPQYALEASPLDWVDLPVSPRFGISNGLEEKNETLETYGGSKYVNRLYSRRVWSLTFRVNETQLADFRTLHQAVNGEATAFYFRYGSDEIYGRKESGFTPTMLTTPADPPRYDYVLTITADPEPLHIS